MPITLRKSIASLLCFFALGTVGVGAQPKAGLATPGNATPAPICPTQLDSAIAQILQSVSSTNRSAFARARWGILIQTLASTNAPRETLYAQDSDRYFLPASNAKLLTTAVALHQLTPQFRIRTSVYQVKSQGKVNLRIVGRGDPSLTDQELSILAQQLRRQGIQSVDQLLGDESYFRGPVPNPQWEWGDIQAGYGAPVNSLILNQNAVGLQLWPQAVGQPLRVQWDDPAEARRWRINNQSVTVKDTEDEFVEVGRDLSQPLLRVQGQLRVGGPPEPVAVAIAEPSQNFLRRFQRALAAQQIRVGQTLVTHTPTTRAETEIAAIASPPLSTLLIETNRESNNLYAEAILRTLGANAGANLEQAADLSTAEQGLAVVQQTLTKLEVEPDSYVLADGSGLSRHNLVSPAALVQTLQASAQLPEAKIYRASLPVAGVSGTLQNRFRDTPVQGRLQAKTGTLSGIAALSGYLNPPQYQPLVFSIIVNHSNQPASTLRQTIDEIVLTLTRLRPCGRNSSF
ncbi:MULTISPECIES: D-alanyl-D-alanine carboxypeptidase/D-alanyl-D-alanine-endopeptidase [Trichocoleus]|uniref:D-alanyl-D-alanine carboxypeptidase/D-alanyl-D-alanine-endopeptidase n=1 Tax=Trichocoleus desertorum GB2-A4 TaxID=2933944 RepID=A0ABV0J7J1_9CYAN|nr:D-alanyl-D-alanine carboxypeptidase/D-alanyl-D-alanine-endopeptidase [Trichocoleus sp. FACHB-46]MBD1862100.1 D-alanyl-D-alanine carboxypeptidase/D-alanyl-D-alanine-endopeptidase [Trichocoleus sp. FACHB-46]